jgi:hypothetical protein
LEVAKTNAANVSYASIVKGRPPATPTTSETATASATASAAPSASATLYKQPWAAAGHREFVCSLPISASADDENQGTTSARIGLSLSADVPHVRLETPQVRPEVLVDPGEVSHAQQEPGDDRRETDDRQLKGALRGSEKEDTNIPEKEFRCGSECTGLFLEAKEKQKSEKSMKLFRWNACRLLAGGRELALVNLLQEKRKQRHNERPQRSMHASAATK